MALLFQISDLTLFGTKGTKVEDDIKSRIKETE